MPTEIITNNPLGKNPQTGLFSLPDGQAFDQAGFDAIFASRINTNKIYKAAYHCEMTQMSNMLSFLDEYTGYGTSCYTNYTLLESYGLRYQFKVLTASVVPAGNVTTVVLQGANDSRFVSNNYVLPQPGNRLILPNLQMVLVTAVNRTAGTVTVRHKDAAALVYNIAANTDLYVVAGVERTDTCLCPTGQFRVTDAPKEIDLEMKILDNAGEICGDALNKCQWLKIDFTHEDGSVASKWYEPAMTDMYKSHEDAIYMDRVFDSKFGIVPIIKAKGLKWVPNDPNLITIDDVREWKRQLTIMGVGVREFFIFAGTNLFSKWQRLLADQAVTNLLYTERPLNDCAWINLEYCGMKVEGLTLHIYEEEMFSNGRGLGGVNSVLPDSAIIFPGGMRSPKEVRSTMENFYGTNGDNKKLTMVYFKDNGGRVHDRMQDSAGVFNNINIYGPGCEKQLWTITSRYTQEVHCPSDWGYMGL